MAKDIFRDIYIAEEIATDASALEKFMTKRFKNAAELNQAALTGDFKRYRQCEIKSGRLAKIWQMSYRTFNVWRY